MPPKTSELLVVNVFANSGDVYSVDYKGARFYPDTYSCTRDDIWLSFACDEHAMFFQHALCYDFALSRHGSTVHFPRYFARLRGV